MQGSYMSVLADQIKDKDELFELKERAPYDGNIVPRTPRQVNRPVIIGRAAQVRGTVFGNEVTLASGTSTKPEEATRTESVYGRKKVTIGDYCMVAGHVTSPGEVEIGNHCTILGTVIGGKVKRIGKNTKIHGNVLSGDSMNIDEMVSIGGYIIVTKGDVAVAKGTEAYDIIAQGSVVLDDDVRLHDPLLLAIDGQLEITKLTVGNAIPITSQSKEFITEKMVYPYRKEMKAFDYDGIMNRLEDACKRI